MNTAAASDRSLLLVEENDVLRELLGDWISLMLPDVRMIKVSDHRAGIVLSPSESPDLVVMDISGHGRDGIETVRGMKSAHPSARILALVTMEHASYRQAVLKAGAEGCASVYKIRGELLPLLEEKLGPS